MTSLVSKLPLYCKYRDRAAKIPHAAKKISVKGLSSAPEMYKNQNEGVVTVGLSNGKELCLKSGKIAKFADGCVTVTFRNTTVMATVVSKQKEGASSFVPLFVSYQQKAAALGRIPLNFLRRELSQTEHEILTSRVIDRSVRPLFPHGFNWDTQIICSPVAIDGSNFPDVLGINAASAALAVSDVPWDGPVGAVRVGLIDGNRVINPTKQELSTSRVNLVVAAKKNKLITMIEGAASEISQTELIKCIRAGATECENIVDGINSLTELVGKEKKIFEKPPVDAELRSAIESLCADKLKSIFQNHEYHKQSRDEAISEVQKQAVEGLDVADKSVANDVFWDVCRDVFRSSIFETEIRCDGRSLVQLRDIFCEVDLYEPLHGSALFQRGQTQVMCTVALDSPNSALKFDKISTLTSGLKEKNFFVHYQFLPFATREAKQLGPVGRREIGHGALAEKALKSIIPDGFPFTIRLTSEVLESNGSSSMATVCGGSLALMDAGVPIERHCAGVALGLVSRCDAEGQTEYKILTDLLGIEDYFGEMDFKIAGTHDTFTALQMDIKNSGVPLDVVFKIIGQGRIAINEILQLMRKACPSARTQKKKNWPETDVVKVPVHLRSKFLGPGGINLKTLEAQTGVEFTEGSVGVFLVFAPNADAMAEAKEAISELLKGDEEYKLEFGGVYTATITEIKEAGCMVTLYPNMKPEYIHVTQLDMRQVRHPSALGLKEGQEIRVKYFGRDPVSGAMRLSRKVLQGPASEVLRTLKEIN